MEMNNISLLLKYFPQQVARPKETNDNQKDDKMGIGKSRDELQATVLRMKPDVAVEAINCLMTLHDYEVCKCIRLDSGNSADVYNMEVIIALVFRLNTYPVSVFRKWLVKRATAPRRTTPPIVIRYKDGLLN